MNENLDNCRRCGGGMADEPYDRKTRRITCRQCGQPHEIWPSPKGLASRAFERVVYFVMATLCGLATLGAAWIVWVMDKMDESAKKRYVGKEKV